MMKIERTFRYAVNSATTVYALSVITFFPGLAEAGEGTAPARSANDAAFQSASAVRELSLEDCLSEAMQNNHRRPASKYAVAMAEAQHRQALAGYWPQITGKASAMRMAEAPNFLFPSTTMSVPPQVITLPAGSLLPANALGAGSPPIPFASLPISTPAQQIRVPEQDVRLMDPESVLASVNATWLLFDGGMRKGYREQGKGLVDMMKEEARRTDLEITDCVKRYYFGAVLARQLHQVGKDTMARMEATLNLTETMYKEGSGKVKKTDYLDNKIMVESLRSAVALLEKNEAMAQAALANTMGLSWNTSVSPSAQEIPFAPLAENLESLVSTAYQFSPDWGKIEAGIRAAEGAVRTAQSGHYPKVALTGELHKWWNNYHYGVASDQNKEGWTVGIGMEIPIFDGFLTRHRVVESRARADKIREEKILLKEGIGLQIKDVFLGLNAAQKSFQATQTAMKSAEENRDLNTRAYQNELVETEKVIRAQLIEALMSAQHYKTRFDHVALQSQLNLLVGTEVLKHLTGLWQKSVSEP